MQQFRQNYGFLKRFWIHYRLQVSGLMASLEADIRVWLGW